MIGVLRAPGVESIRRCAKRASRRIPRPASRIAMLCSCARCSEHIPIRPHAPHVGLATLRRAAGKHHESVTVAANSGAGHTLPRRPRCVDPKFPHFPPPFCGMPEYLQLGYPPALHRGWSHQPSASWLAWDWSSGRGRIERLYRRDLGPW